MRQSSFALQLLAFTLTAHLAWASVAAADPRSLAKGSDRPTVAKFLAELTPWPSANPFGSRALHEQALEDLRRRGPQLIALMEAAYPGATWAPMGRDAAPTADLLEAFYLEIGQVDRVRRLLGSGMSFRSATLETLAEYLEQADFRFGPEAPSPWPLILLDRTDYFPESQVRRLLRAGYQVYIERGGLPAELFARFNAVSLGVRSVEPRVFEAARYREYFAESPMSGAPDALPSRILALSLPARNDEAYLQGVAAWHQGYGRLRRELWSRKLSAPPSALESLENRSQILALMFEVVRIVRSPPFVAQVKAEAQKLGYEFPVRRAQTLLRVSLPEGDATPGVECQRSLRP